MTSKEKKEIIEVFEKLIKYLEDNLDVGSIYMCWMIQFIGVRYCNILQKCGFNDRMIPQAIEYLKSQRPSKTMNRVIYDKPCIRKFDSNCWWLYAENPSMSINLEKIQFLKHLINKLKK